MEFPTTTTYFASANRMAFLDHDNFVAGSSSSAFSPPPSSRPLPPPPRSAFETQVQQLFWNHSVPAEIVHARNGFIANLQQQLQQSLGPGFRFQVQLFGSSVTGLSNAYSDLDLCIMDESRPRGFEKASDKVDEELPSCYNVRQLANILRQNRMFTTVQPIEAAVPICKFSATFGGYHFSGDLNCNERFGVYNSAMLNAYLSINPGLVKVVAIFLKYWAKSRGLNDPSGSRGITTLSSYSIILLLIAYLQTVGILPNLQDPNLLKYRQARLFFTLPRKSGNGSVRPPVGFNTDFLPTSALNWSGRTMSIEDAILGFFEFYSGMGFDTTSSIVSISSGGVRLRRIPYGASDWPGKKKKEKKTKDKKKSDIPALEAKNALEEATHTPLPDSESDSDASVSAGGDAKEEERIEPGPEATEEDLEPEWNQSQQGEDNNAPQSGQVHEDGATEEQNIRWRSEKLVIQDPFILTRNTAQNIQARVVDVIVEEFARAASLIRRGAPLQYVCASPFEDPVAWPPSLLQTAQRQREWMERQERRAMGQAARAQNGERGRGRGRGGWRGGDGTDRGRGKGSERGTGSSRGRGRGRSQ
ncbi:hypothetical protein BT69DRAFT_209030 [Atractiella rhizophila]|nr:hypothetical protein BT69DRAFT_209030 [Atractiella rhizophila]